MNNCYGAKYAAVVADLKTQLKDVRADLNEEDGKYPHIQKIIYANWDK